MPAAALALPQPDQAAPPAIRPARIPPKVRRACELLADGNVRTVTAAAERVGMSREWLTKMLGRVHIRAFLARKAAETISMASLRASSRLVELIDAESEHVAAKVSERILTSEGILKSDQGSISVNVDVRAGFVIDLTDQQSSPMPHMREIEPKPLIEHTSGSDDATALPNQGNADR